MGEALGAMINTLPIQVAFVVFSINKASSSNVDGGLSWEL